MVVALLRRLEAQVGDPAAQEALVARVAGSWRGRSGAAGEAWAWLDEAAADFEAAVEELDAAGCRAHAPTLLDVATCWPATQVRDSLDAETEPEPAPTPPPSAAEPSPREAGRIRTEVEARKAEPTPRGRGDSSAARDAAPQAP
jgi:hypothetical protein